MSRIDVEDVVLVARLVRTLHARPELAAGLPGFDEDPAEFVRALLRREARAPGVPVESRMRMTCLAGALAERVTPPPLTRSTRPVGPYSDRS